MGVEDDILRATAMFLASISYIQTHSYFGNGRVFLEHLVSGLDINWLCQ
jgi:hypothetical protein